MYANSKKMAPSAGIIDNDQDVQFTSQNIMESCPQLFNVRRAQHSQSANVERHNKYFQNRD